MVFKGLGDDIRGIMARDPAARSKVEVVLCYPGFHALVFYHLSHGAWARGWHLVGRFVSHVGRVLTGIEIHPGARIGRGLFIDHGMGVVIGETAEVGNEVTLYQGVTLGGTSLDRNTKRHPTLEDGVIVGAGAKILGPFTVGARARVGSNAVVVGEVPAGATVVGIPAKEIRRERRGEKAEFMAYGTPDKIPDPVARALDSLRDQVATLKGRLEALEGGNESVAAPKRGRARTGAGRAGN